MEREAGIRNGLAMDKGQIWGGERGIGRPLMEKWDYGKWGDGVKMEQWKAEMAIVEREKEETEVFGGNGKGNGKKKRRMWVINGYGEE